MGVLLRSPSSDRPLPPAPPLLLLVPRAIPAFARQTVESISIYVRDPGASRAEQVFLLEITDLDPERRALRRAMVQFVQAEMARFNTETAEEEARTGRALRKNEAVVRFMKSLRERVAQVS